MKNKKTRFGGYAVLYLVVVLIFILLYLGLAFPKLSAEINTADTQIQGLRTEINLLKPYINQVVELNKKSEKSEKEFAESTELDEPIMFSNILYECADKSGVVLKNVTVTENSPVEIAGKLGSKNLFADVSLTAASNAQVESFVALLEKNEGSAMNVQTVNYAIGDGAVEASLSIMMLTVEK